MIIRFYIIRYIIQITEYIIIYESESSSLTCDVEIGINILNHFNPSNPTLNNVSRNYEIDIDL